MQLEPEFATLLLAVSQAVGPNYLVWYSILCALTASVGTWVVHFTSYLWHNVFEGYILQEESRSLKVCCCAWQHLVLCIFVNSYLLDLCLHLQLACMQCKLCRTQRRVHICKQCDRLSSTPVQEKNLMHGVDVTHSRFFDQPKVKEAVAFAAEAHRGQARKTKEPYVAHCIETACIVEEVLDLAEDSEYISR